MVKQGKKETEAKIKGQVFVSTEEGSATWKSLDGEGLTAKYEKGPTEYTKVFEELLGVGNLVLNLCVMR
ncbi:MAG: hypothetical protein GX923_00850 [Clostridia bacterium]|nr:hypothetical protein [Clostridia bacterium]